MQETRKASSPDIELLRVERKAYLDRIEALRAAIDMAPKRERPKAASEHLKRLSNTVKEIYRLKAGGRLKAAEEREVGLNLKLEHWERTLRNIWRNKNRKPKQQVHTHP